MSATIELPHSIEAEQSVLGAALLSAEAATDIVELVDAEDFYRPAHRHVFETMKDMYANGVHIDTLSLFDQLFKRELLGVTGGGTYLHDLISMVPTAANASYYARMIREKAILRRMMEAGARLQAYGNSHEDVDDLVERAQAEVFAITSTRAREDYLPISDIMPPALDEIASYGQRQTGNVLTGFRDLDELTQGFYPGQFIVIGARPAIGKSVLGLDFARYAAKQDQTAAIFSLEMSRVEIMIRLLAAECRVNLHKIRAGRLDDDEWTRIARRMSEMCEAPLFVDDSPNLSMMEIRAKCRRLKMRHNLKLVVVDYLQLMEYQESGGRKDGGARKENRQQEVSAISRSLKLLAKELEVPVVAMSQLNRGPEQRTDKRPQVADLRESGSVEQDADMVILLHREDAYDRESPRAGEADLIVAKHRNGPTATVTVAFQGHYARFVDMARRN